MALEQLQSSGSCTSSPYGLLNMVMRTLALLLHLTQLLLVLGSHVSSSAVYRGATATPGDVSVSPAVPRTRRFSLEATGSPARTHSSAIADVCAQVRCRWNSPILFVFHTGRAFESAARRPEALPIQWAALATQRTSVPVTAANTKYTRCLPLRSTAGISPASVRIHSKAPKKKEMATSLSIEPDVPIDEREAALRYQQQQLVELLNPSSETADEAPSGMSDEEFSREVGISVGASPRAVVAKLAKWRGENPTSPLASQLHRKWMEVFEQHVLQHLKAYEDEKKTEEGWVTRALHILLGGSPLAAGSTILIPDAPSELDASYSDMLGHPESFRGLAEQARKEEAAQAAQRFSQRLRSSAKLFLPLLAVGTAVQRAAPTALFAASGIAGRLICGQPARSTQPRADTMGSDRPSLRTHCLSAAVLGAHALAGLASAFCAWKLAGLANWIPLRGLATGAVIGQWWLASAFYRFRSPEHPQKCALGGDASSVTQLDGATEGNRAEEMIRREGPNQNEWLFNDPDLPTAFRDET